MHDFDQSVCGCVVCPDSECMVLTSLCVIVWLVVQRVNAPVCVWLCGLSESECMVLTSLCVAVWFVRE